MTGSKEKNFAGLSFAHNSAEDASLNLNHLPKYHCYKAAALKEKKNSRFSQPDRRMFVWTLPRIISG